MPVTGKLKIKISVAYTKEFDLSTPKDPLSLARQISISSAVGADYPADLLWHDCRTLADAASEIIDLYNLTDAFGDTTSFSNLKCIYIRNNSEDANLLIGGSDYIILFTSSDTIIQLPPQGVFYTQFERADGLIIEPGEDKIKIAHDGTGSDSLTYDIVLVGHTTQPTPTPTASPTPTPSPSPTPTPTPT